MKTFLAIFFILSCLSGFSQKKQKRQFVPAPSIEYVFQNKHTIGTYIALPIEGKKRPHSFIIPNLGGSFFYHKRSMYFSPGASLELYHQLDKQQLPFGLYFRVGYSYYQINGQKDHVISTDVGLSKFYFHVFAGYNFTPDKKSDVNPITPFRIGIKLL